MLVDSFHDTGVFFASFLCGQIIGFVFDLFRGYRKNKKVSKNVLSVQDSLFCAFAFYLFYKTVCLTNSGEIRWYTIAGVVLGASLYFTAESMYIMKVINTVWKIFFAVTNYIAKFFGRIFDGSKKVFCSTKNGVSDRFLACKNHFSQFFIKKRTKNL